MKKQKGITLIALVISIIVMLILAGVSINAIVGENGVLSRAQYSSFMNEMAAVEEAVQLWKAGELIESKGKVNTAIPTEGLWEIENIKEENITEATKRLIGEIGYYRVWGISGNMPENNILTLDDSLYKAFKGEFIVYPAGIQDLYYLNNEALDLKDDKVYLIDASTSMVYSTTGITLNGVRCYSTSMAKAVMGNNVAPLFAEAEVSGTGTGGALAGNISSEYLMDENGEYILDADGNKIKNENYNENGFQIIADSSNTNLYKLYNNGDLYAKGVKGYLMNSSEIEMNEIDYTKWQKFNVPEEIPGSSTNSITIIPGHSTMYIIDSNGDLWAWGDNSYNKLGLTQSQRVEYTGMVPIKLNINGKKVYKVFPTRTATYVITVDNGIYELYACGYNEQGQLGTGIKKATQDQFMKVDFENPEKIINITSSAGKDVYELILVENEHKNKIYFAGATTTGSSTMKSLFENTDLNDTYVTKYIEIFNGKYGNVLDYNVINISGGCDWNARRINLVSEDGKLYRLISGGTISEITINGNLLNIEQFEAYTTDYALLKMRVESQVQFWCNKIGSGSNIFGDVEGNTTWKLVNDYFPSEMDANNVKDFYISGANVFYLMNDGKIFASGFNSGAGIGVATGNVDNIICLQDYSDLPLIDEFICSKNTGNLGGNTVLLKAKDGNIYGTGNKTILFREDILQKSWTKIASNVKKFNAKTTGDSLAYIDFNNDIWVLGADARYLGMGRAEGGVIRNFIRLKDYIIDTEMYTHIDGNCKDYTLGSYSLRILTNANDNNTLYVSGLYKSSTWYIYNRLGIDDTEDHYALTKVMENIKFWNGKESDNFAITMDNKLYCWGLFDGNGGFTSSIPKEMTISTVENVNISMITNISHYNKYMLMNNGDFYVAGYGHASNTMNGLNSNSYSTFTKYNSEAFGNETVKDIVPCSTTSWIVLTEEGNIWGCGASNDLGIGSTDSGHQVTPIKVYDKGDIVQITGGLEWFVAVTNEGKVYGTGSNQYGILGRWIGVDRDTPNSRYKTAFDWVECPELEI